MTDTYKVEGVEYDIDKRSDCDIDHHPKSVELFNRIRDIDERFNDDSFDWRSGGDGDNGEELMYLLDIIFDEDDNQPGT